MLKDSVLKSVLLLLSLVLANAVVSCAAATMNPPHHRDAATHSLPALPHIPKNIPRVSKTGLRDSYTGDCGSSCHWTVDTADKTLHITGSGEMDDYVFFFTPWLMYAENVTTVKIDNGITSIGTYAFSILPLLTSVTIPKSVTRIGELAFFLCSSLKSITIPTSVSYIGVGAFYSATNLTSINVAEPNPYYTSKDGVLFDDKKHTLMAYPAGNSRTSYTVPKSVRSINASAFGFAGYLESLTIPGCVSFVGDEAFNTCANLKKVKYLGSGDPAKGSSNMFENSPLLASVEVPKTYEDEFFCGKNVEKGTFNPDNACASAASRIIEMSGFAIITLVALLLVSL